MQLPPRSQIKKFSAIVRSGDYRCTARAIDETTELDTVTVYAPGVHNPFA